MTTTLTLCDFCTELTVCDCEPTIDGVGCEYYSPTIEEALLISEYEQDLKERVEVYADYLKEASSDMYVNFDFSDYYYVDEEDAYFD